MENKLWFIYKIECYKVLKWMKSVCVNMDVFEKCNDELKKVVKGY